MICDSDLLHLVIADNDVGPAAGFWATERQCVQAEQLFVFWLAVIYRINVQEQELDAIPGAGIINEHKVSSSTTKAKSHKSCCSTKLLEIWCDARSKYGVL